jgi:hypothetical protein
MGIAKTFMFTQRRTSPEDPDIMVLVFWPLALFICLPVFGIFLGCDYVWVKIFRPIEQARAMHDRMIEDKREYKRNPRIKRKEGNYW